MVRAGALAKNNASSLDLLDVHDPHTPTGVQLLAKSVDELLGSLDRLEALAATSRPWFGNIAAVDLNFGCPSPDVIRNGSGPAMLKRRGRLLELFTALVAWKAETGLSIHACGCKIRLGLNRVEKEAKVYLALVDVANEAGLDFVTVHARHAGQRSRDPPTWDAIREVKARARAGLAVIGNGNVFSALDAVAMREQTGCDGVMLARAAMRNPMVFSDFLPSAPPQSEVADWDGGRMWPSLAEVDAARINYASMAAELGTKPKFVAFHDRNFLRLREVALTGNRALPVDSPSTVHLT